MRIPYREIFNVLGYDKVREGSYDLYVAKNKSVADIIYLIEIETGFSISDQTMREKLRKMGIRTDKDGRHDQIAQYYGYSTMKEMLETEYPVVHSQDIMGQKIGVCQKTIGNWLREYGIKRFGRGGANNKTSS